jgi:hypothetical protein
MALASNTHSLPPGLVWRNPDCLQPRQTDDCATSGKEVAQLSARRNVAYICVFKAEDGTTAPLFLELAYLSRTECGTKTMNLVMIGVLLDFVAVLGHRFHPFINVWIVLEHPGKLHPWMPRSANLEPYEFRPFLEAGLGFRLELGQRFLARRTFGTDSEGLRAARPIAVAVDPFHENWNLHPEPP